MGERQSSEDSGIPESGARMLDHHVLRVLPQFNRVFSEAHSAKSVGFARFTSLSVNQVLALAFIEQCQELGQAPSLGDVAAAVGVSNAAASKLMDRLERSELCVRLKAPGLNKKRIVLTAKGEKVLTQLSSAIASLQDSGVNERLRDDFIALAEQIIQEFGPLRDPSRDSTNEKD